MNAMQSRTTRSERETALVHFVIRLTEIFARLPNLVGFSVLERATLGTEREPACLDAELSVADVAVHTWPGAQGKAPGNEIAAALLELLDEHPSVRELLRGYTFARTFH